MAFILILLLTVHLSSALDPVNKTEPADEKIRSTFAKYLEKIPDIVDQYVVDERLTRAISHYYDGKLSAFPLFRVNVKIDRNPVKIPWTVPAPNVKKEMEKRGKQKRRPVQKRYKYLKSVNGSRINKGLPRNKLTKKSKPNLNLKKITNNNSQIVFKSDDTVNERKKKNYNIVIDKNAEKLYKNHETKKVENKREVSGAEKDLGKIIAKEDTTKSPKDLNTSNGIKSTKPHPEKIATPIPSVTETSSIITAL